jgi:hypothetical protein
MVHLVDVTESMGISVFEAVNEGSIVDMGVKVDNMERLIVCSDNWKGNSMVAS